MGRLQVTFENAGLDEVRGRGRHFLNMNIHYDYNGLLDWSSSPIH
jgi:hypothetical protein